MLSNLVWGKCVLKHNIDYHFVCWRVAQRLIPQCVTVDYADSLDNDGEQYEHNVVDVHVMKVDTSVSSHHCDVVDDYDDENYYDDLVEQMFIEKHGIESFNAWCRFSLPTCSSVSISTIVTTTSPLSCATSNMCAPALSLEHYCKIFFLLVIVEDEPFKFCGVP